MKREGDYFQGLGARGKELRRDWKKARKALSDAEKAVSDFLNPHVGSS